MPVKSRSRPFSIPLLISSLGLNRPLTRSSGCGLLFLLLLFVVSLPDYATPTYCSFARNTADSLYFVPHYFVNNDLPKAKMAPVNMTGKWKLDRSENFEDMLKVLDMGFMARKIALAITPTHVIEQNDDEFVIRISTPRGTQEMKFKVGDEFTQKALAYQGEFKCTTSWDGASLRIKYDPIDDKKRSVEETREMIDDEYILTIYLGDVVCKRIFKRYS